MTDETDRRLIALLRRDGRMSLTDLAGHLGLARATVRARIERLRAEGEIAGFTVLTRADLGAGAVRGLTLLAVEGRGAERVAAQLLGLPQVRAVHATNGRWDLVAEIVADDLTALDATLGRIRRIDGVAASETSLLLSTRLPGATR